ncbi:chlorophyll A-B binding protein [Nitzschia inconspicua]|uniref:Chlorophyll A-B binding protein n=1 Tax=Nitzschia inconspicua TaxID=303405 RepID=A0A9K3L1J0_9STRA|nr:chlorophyll A-B binding protein [Nitzschia inconspicua]
MKVALSLLALVASASAFAPSTSLGASRSVLRMSDEEAAPEEAAAPAPAPAAVSSKATSVPCFGAAPFFGGNDIFVGKTEWDLLTTKWGSAETGTYLRASELKHGRSAMIATVGYAFHKLGLTLDNISPHEYLSVTQNIKFADLAAMNPVDAMKSLPVESWGQMFAAIAIIEIYEMTHSKGKLAYDETVAPGLQPGGLTGDLGWNPLKITVDDRRRLVELQNGRAAMFAITAWVSAECIPGSFPLPLPW